jgi:hypothetical protein
MASLAITFAIANQNIATSIVEATEFPDLAQRYQVYGVPRTVINDDRAIEGATPAGVLLENILAVTQAKAAQ